MSNLQAFSLGVAIVAIGGWGLVGWLAWLKSRDKPRKGKPSQA